MYLCILLSNIIRYFKIFLHDAHTHLEMLKVSKNMLKISKSVKNYSKYHLQIFAGKYDKLAGNFRNCRQSIFAGKLTAKPMSSREKSVKQISCFSHFLIWCCLLKSISVKDNDGDDDSGEIIRGCHPLANDFQLKGCIDIVTESGVSNGTLLTGNEAR